MSIIHDALKKVQSKNPDAAPFAETPRRNSDTSMKQPAAITQENTNHSLVILMAAVLTVAVIVILGVLFKLSSDTTQHARPAGIPKPSAAVAVATLTAPEASTAANKTPAPTPASIGIRVEGVMDRGGKMVALINGDVYEEGQSVEGNVITAITFANVTVMGKDSKMVLPVKR